MSASRGFPVEARFVAATPAWEEARVAAASALLPAGVSLLPLAEAWAGGRRATATLTLTQDAPGAAGVLASVARTLGAVQAGAYHPLHRQAVVLPAANRAATASGIIPPHGAVLPGVPEDLPAEIAELALPVPPQALDLARLPEAVWWLNLWTVPVLRAFPPGVVAAAPWIRQERLEGALLLAVADTPPGPAHPEGFAAARAVTEALGLHAMQRAAAEDLAP
jgi:hypothetical protein